MKVRDICAGIADGSHNPPQGIEISDYLMLSSKNIFDDEITFDDPRYLTQADFEQEDRRTKVKEGDVLLTIVGTVGRTAVVDKKMPRFTLQRSVAVLKPKADICSSRYLMYALQGERTHIENSAKGVAQKGIYLNEVSNIDLRIPALSEQESIVIRLDKIVSIIHFYQQQLQKLDELVKSRFVEIFIGKNYSRKTVDEVSLGKGEYGAQSASAEYTPDRPRYVRITDINDDGTLSNDVVSSINHSDDDQYRLRYGDFLFARMGATVGKTYAFKEGNQIYAGYLIRYKLDLTQIHPLYLFWYTRLNEYWDWVKLNQSGAAQPGINAKKFGSLRIPVPPIDIQNRFVAFVAEVDKSKLAVKQSLEKLETLKKSLMQQYFG